MLNREVFIYFCKDKGMTEKQAEELYEKTAKKCKKKKPKVTTVKRMYKTAFDLGFNDAMRVCNKLFEDK